MLGGPEQRLWSFCVLGVFLSSLLWIARGAHQNSAYNLGSDYNFSDTATKRAAGALLQQEPHWGFHHKHRAFGCWRVLVLLTVPWFYSAQTAVTRMGCAGDICSPYVKAGRWKGSVFFWGKLVLIKWAFAHSLVGKRSCVCDCLWKQGELSGSGLLPYGLFPWLLGKGCEKDHIH